MAKQTQALAIPERAPSAEQMAALDTLAEGKSAAEAAATAGVTPATVAKWRRHDPWFIAELNRRRQDAWSEAEERLRGLAPRAISALADELEKGATHRLQAALHVLKLVGWYEPGKPTGETTPAEVIDDMARELFSIPSYSKPSDLQRRTVLAKLARDMGEG